LFPAPSSPSFPPEPSSPSFPPEPPSPLSSSCGFLSKGRYAKGANGTLSQSPGRSR
jgi:hypothetical protein